MVFKCWPECWAIRMQKKHEINAQNQSSRTLRFRAAISVVKPKGNQFKYDLWEKEAQLIMLHENQISVFSRNSRLKAACWAGVCHLFFLSFYVTWAVNMQNSVKLKQSFKFLIKSSPMSKAESLKVNMFTRVKANKLFCCVEHVPPCCRDFFTSGYWDCSGSACFLVSPSVTSLNKSFLTVSWKHTNQWVSYQGLTLDSSTIKQPRITLVHIVIGNRFFRPRVLSVEPLEPNQKSKSFRWDYWPTQWNWFGFTVLLH